MNSEIQDAVVAAVRATSVDLSIRLPVRNEGLVPVVPRQWLWIAADSGLVDCARHIRKCGQAITDLTPADKGRVGKRLPREILDLAEVRATMITSIEELGWFAPPEGDSLGQDLDKLIESSNHLLAAIEGACISTLPPVQLVSAISAGREAEQLVAQGISNESVSDRSPLSLLHEVFEIDPLEDFASSALEPNTLRGLSALDTEALESLSGRLLGHLVLPAAKWMPSATVQLAAMLVAERPLIAHRMAFFSRDLICDVWHRTPDRAVKALVAERKGGPSQFASSKEIAVEIEAMAKAHESGNAEGAALATARLYAAATEGAVRGVTTTLLLLHGVKVPPESTLTYLRDQIRGKTGPMIDFSLAIDPTWRNAVDHREFHWNPMTQTLSLRGEEVAADDIFNTYALGMAGVAGLECGATLAVAAHPRLLERVDRISPLHQDRVLVEHRLAQQLAAQGVSRPRVHMTPTGIRIGPLGDDEIIFALGALVGSLDVLREIDRFEVRFESLPPLTTTRKALVRASRIRPRDSENHRVLDPGATNPIFACALIELGEEPSYALERCARAAGDTVAQAAKSAGEVSRKSLARRLSKAAKRATRAIREIEIVANESSPAVTRLSASLRRVEQSTAQYEQGQTATPDQMLRNLKEFFNLLEELPSDALPWFRGQGSGEGQPSDGQGIPVGY